MQLQHRYAPHIPFPAYAYVPGIHNHPRHHPLGHSYKAKEPEVEAPVPEEWENCEYYLYGIDLFNYGYYWEAHEAWETVWHACGHVGPTADFLKALIKLTAAGVKVRQQLLNGVQVHAANASKLFQQLKEQLETDTYMGLCFNTLIEFTEELSKNPFMDGHDIDEPCVVFDLQMIPEK